MNIGRLYRLNKKYWFIFRTKELAAKECVSIPLDNNNIQVFSENALAVLLEQDGVYKKILTSDGYIGWILLRDKYNDCFEEVKSE
jgi:hypothetical protein